MLHRHQLIYVGDRYCTSTGKTLHDAPRLMHIDDVDPQTFTILRTSYKNIQTVTGRIVSSFLYTRHSTSNISNLSQSFWWVELKDKFGEIHTFSIDAETPVLESVEKGDILSVISPESLTLTHEIKDAKTRALVTHDKQAPVVIMHGDGGQQCQINSWFTPKVTSRPFWYAPASILTFIALVYFWGFAPETLVGGVGTCLLIFLIEIYLKNKSLKIQQEKYAVLTSSIDKLLRIKKEQLGFHLEIGQQKETDIFCHGCEGRIPCSVAFCPMCRASQHDHKRTYSVKTVSSIENSLIKRFSLHYKQHYTHERTLSRNEQTDVNVSCLFAQVLSHNTRSHVNDVTTLTNITRNYDTYRSKTSINTRHETSASLNGLRQSQLYENLIIKLANGEVREQAFPKQIVCDLDEGDWFIYATTSANTLEPFDNIEYGYNLSKKQHFVTKSFLNYSGPKAFGKWVLLLLTFSIVNWAWATNIGDPFVNLLGLSVSDMSSLYSQITVNLPFVIFSMLTLFWCIRSINASKNNRRARKTILSPLNELIQKFESELLDLQSNIKRIS